MKYILLILLAGITTFKIAYPAEDPTEVLTLEKSINIALENNLNIKISDSDIDIMQARLLKSKASYYPEIEFKFIAPFVGRESGIFADQLLWDFGRTPNLVKASKGNLAASNYSKYATVNDVILNTKIGYYNILISKNYLDSSEHAVKEFEKKLEQIDNFVRLGRSSRLELTKARVNYSQAKLDLINRNHQFNIAKEELINILGLNSVFNYELHDYLHYNEYEDDIDEVIKAALKNRPELKKLQSQILSKRATLKASKQDHYPKLVARTAYRFDGDGATGPDFIAGIGINFPLFKGFSKTASVNESIASLTKIQNVMELTKRNIMLEIKKLFYDIKSARQKIKVTKEALVSSEETLELTQELYNAGRNSQVELLEAMSLYSSSKSNNSQSIYYYKIAKAKLDWATAADLSDLTKN